MYHVVNRSTGVVVTRFLNRADAVQWVLENNVDENGEFLPLYKVVNTKTKKAQEAA